MLLTSEPFFSLPRIFHRQKFQLTPVNSISTEEARKAGGYIENITKKEEKYKHAPSLSLSRRLQLSSPHLTLPFGLYNTEHSLGYMFFFPSGFERKDKFQHTMNLKMFMRYV